MQRRGLMVLLLALVFAGAAVFIVRGYLADQAGPKTIQAGPSMETTKVVVAKLALNIGDRIAEEHLRVVEWPKASLPEHTFKNINELTKGDEPRVALNTIEVGEPILGKKVSGPGGRAILSTRVGANMRAMTVRVNDVLGVGGFVMPGDRIDILLTRDEGGSKNPATNILLQNVRVLGIDQIASNDQEKPVVAKAVTVEVGPHEAQKLTLGAQVGILTLALRNISNTSATPERTVTLNDLRETDIVQSSPAKEEVKVVAAPQPKRVSRPRLTNVTIIRALKPSEYKVRPETGETPRAPVSRASPVQLIPTDNIEN